MARPSIALELVNTATAEQDRLETRPAAERWAIDLGGPIDVDPERLRALRDAVKSLVASALEGRSFPDSATESVNRFTAAAPSFARLENGAAAYVTLASPSDAFLGELAADAVELVGTARRELLRRCNAPRCGRLFLAGRANQRWCSDRCGARARLARFRRR